ncbi:hypothetical protein P7C73_g5653, partial [Tremellales sp. Uapishka_1]
MVTTKLVIFAFLATLANGLPVQEGEAECYTRLCTFLQLNERDCSLTLSSRIVYQHCDPSRPTPQTIVTRVSETQSNNSTYNPAVIIILCLLFGVLGVALLYATQKFSRNLILSLREGRDTEHVENGPVVQELSPRGFVERLNQASEMVHIRHSKHCSRSSVVFNFELPGYDASTLCFEEAKTESKAKLGNEGESGKVNQPLAEGEVSPVKDEGGPAEIDDGTGSEIKGESREPKPSHSTIEVEVIPLDDEEAATKDGRPTKEDKEASNNGVGATTMDGEVSKKDEDGAKKDDEGMARNKVVVMEGGKVVKKDDEAAIRDDNALLKGEDPGQEPSGNKGDRVITGRSECEEDEEEWEKVEEKDSTEVERDKS